jgi:uncharacterized protein
VADQAPLSEAEPPLAERICWSCHQVVGAGRFCKWCGVDLDRGRHLAARQAQVRKVRTAARLELLPWRQVKGVLLFYVIYLSTILPLAWMPDGTVVASMLVVSVIDALLILIAVKKLGGVVFAMFRWSPAIPRYAGIGLAALAVLLPLDFGYHHLLISWLGLTSPGITKPFIDEGFGLVIQIVSIAVMPGIWEEIAFRGVIQTTLTKATGRRQALILTAFLFGIIHCAWFSLPYLVLIGLVLGWLRQRSGSLLPGMILHFTHNLAVVLAERWWG